MEPTSQQPNVELFKRAIEACCRDWDLCITHEDIEGGFQIRPLSEDALAWLQEARTVPEKFER